MGYISLWINCTWIHLLPNRYRNKENVFSLAHKSGKCRGYLGYSPSFQESDLVNSVLRIQENATGNLAPCLELIKQWTIRNSLCSSGFDYIHFSWWTRKEKLHYVQLSRQFCHLLREDTIATCCRNHPQRVQYNCSENKSLHIGEEPNIT